VPVGMYFSRVGSDFSDPQPNVALQISNNVIRDNNTGITEDASDPAPLVVDSAFAGNTIRDDRFSGLVLAPSNDGNLISGNVAHGNGTYGIRLLGAVGTTVVGNTMTQNGVLDAIDLRPADNVWSNNTCLQANPASLCS
jgi:parallel beta-helix repeat protein